MAHEFVLPDIGEGLTEAEIVAWLVDVGDEIADGQPLCEIETAKAVVELPSPYTGVVLHLGAAIGETLEVGDVVAVIGEAGEKWHASDRNVAPPTERDVAETSERPRPARVRAMPIVRRLAKEHGVELSEVTGTGPSGQITREDVMSHARATSERPESERVRLTATRRAIAAHLSRSWREIPHVTTYDDVDAAVLLDARRGLSDDLGVDVSIDALMVLAVVPALRAHPEFNATLDGDDLLLHRTYDIGIAVDTADGLLVPVVRNADRLPPADLVARIDELSTAARERTLRPEQLGRGTFTISNIGALGGGHGTPIIPHGTTAILSFGRARETPVARDGNVEIRPIMPLSLSYDHRVIDGALGRRFVDRLTRSIGDPATFDSR